MCISYEWQRRWSISEIILEPSTRNGCAWSWKHCLGCPSWKHPVQTGHSGKVVPSSNRGEMGLGIKMPRRISGEEVSAAGYYIRGIVGAVADLGPSSWVKGRVRTETASVGLALTEQSVPQRCAHTKHVCMTVIVTFFLCDVYVAMNSMFLCSHSTKNTFQEKNHVMVTVR